MKEGKLQYLTKIGQMASKSVTFKQNPRQSNISLQSELPRPQKTANKKISEFLKTITPELQSKMEQFLKKHILDIYPRISTERINIYEQIYIIFCFKTFEDKLEEPQIIANILKMINKDTGRSELTVKLRLKKMSQLSLETIQYCMNEHLELPLTENRKNRKPKVKKLIRWIGMMDEEKINGLLGQEQIRTRQRDKKKSVEPVNVDEQEEDEGEEGVQVEDEDYDFDGIIKQLRNELNEREKIVDYKRIWTFQKVADHIQNRVRQIQQKTRDNKQAKKNVIVIEDEKSKKQNNNNNIVIHEDLQALEKKSTFTFACRESIVVPFPSKQPPQNEVKISTDFGDKSIFSESYTKQISKKEPAKILFVYKQSTKELFPIKNIDSPTTDLALQQLKQESLQAQQSMKNLFAALFKQQISPLAVVDEEEEQTKIEASHQQIEEEKNVYKRYMKFLDEIQQNIKMVKPTENNLTMLLYLQNATTKMKISSKLNYEQFRAEMGLASQTSKTKTGSKKTINLDFEQDQDEIFNKSGQYSQEKQSSQESSEKNKKWEKVQDELLKDYINNPVQFELEFFCLRRYKSIEQIRSRMERLKILPPNLKLAFLQSN